MTTRVERDEADVRGILEGCLDWVLGDESISSNEISSKRDKGGGLVGEQEGEGLAERTLVSDFRSETSSEISFLAQVIRFWVVRMFMSILLLRSN